MITIIDYIWEINRSLKFLCTRIQFSRRLKNTRNCSMNRLIFEIISKKVGGYISIEFDYTRLDEARTIERIWREQLI